MASVTKRINNYLSGVSKQPDSKKKPGQVRECINGFPDITTGLTKRPGFKFTAILKNVAGTAYNGSSATSELDGAKWFYINRGDGNRFIGCVTPKDGSTMGEILVWDADTGAAKTVNYSGTARNYLTGSRDNYDVLTVHDTTMITNNTVTVTARPAPTFVAKSRGTIVIVGSLLKLREYTVKGSVDGNTWSYAVTATDKIEDIIDGIETAITGSGINMSNFTLTKLANTIQIDKEVSGVRTSFTLTAEGGQDRLDVVVFQDWAENSTNLPPQSIHDHVVEVINTKDDNADNYYAKFVANDGVSGFGYWLETVGPNVSLGFDLTTMPHRLLYDSGTGEFTFGQIPFKDREVGDDITNSHPSFVGSQIQQAFFHQDRLGFLSTDNVVMSKQHDPFNFYFLSAMGTGDADPMDIATTSIRPAVLHAVKPSRQGLILFAKTQQFLMYADNGPLTTRSTKIQAISSMEMDDKVDPVDVGSHFNFISKTPNYTRVFAMQTKGFGENPTVLDIGRVVNEWITIDVDNMIASRQNDFIAMSSQSSDKVYFYKTYTDGQELLMESWYNWQLPGLVQTLASDQDDFFAVTKQGDEYTLSAANLTQSPETSIIVSNSGLKVNPCFDLYTQATSVTFADINSIAVTNGGSGYTSTPTITISAPFNSQGTQATATAVVAGGAVTAINITNAGSNYVQGAIVTITGGGGSNATATATVDPFVGSKCYVPFANIPDKKPVLIVAGSNASGTFVESGFTLTPEVATDDGGVTHYFKVPIKDLTSFANDVYVGWAYDFDVILPTLYFTLDEQGAVTDYTARLNIARMHFDLGLSGILGFKLNSNGRFAGSRTYTADGSQTDFVWAQNDFDFIDRSQIKVKVNNVIKTITTDYTFLNDVTIQFNSAPANGDVVLLYLDEWYDIQPTTKANSYLANDVPLDESIVFTIPIHQRSTNYKLRLFSDSPFPLSINSMMWEGTYSPRYYRRT